MRLACAEALIKGYDRIVVYWKGFFFDAVKNDTSAAVKPVRR
jgi:hypothetical protein